MTISSSTRKAGPFTGNGVTVAFPFAFKVFASADVLVVQAVTATGVETNKVITTDYLVVLNADQNANPGGTVTLLIPPPVGTTLTLTSQVGNLQPVDLTNNGGFYPKVINDALDRVTIQIQQVAEQVSRAFKVSLSSGSSAGNTIFDYMSVASASAVASAASATTSGAYAAQSSAFALNSSLSAAASAASAVSAAASAQAATTPTGSALALYLDAFTTGVFITFTTMYLAGGWDLGGLAAASPFPNENSTRRTMLSTGGGSFNFGTVP